jgi:anthranilate/para-aminobenzoate synthase component I
MAKTELQTALNALMDLESSSAELRPRLSAPSRIQGLVDGAGPTDSGAGFWIFREPTGLIEARNQYELEVACLAIDKVSQSCHVILLIDYEVGAWFEPKLKIAPEAHPWAPFQAWVFGEATWLPNHAFHGWLTENLEKKDEDIRSCGIADIRAEISEPEYLDAVRSALEYIASGEIYQLNLTWRYDFTHFGSALALYRKLRLSQPVNHGAYLALPNRKILSLSPELFLESR